MNILTKIISFLFLSIFCVACVAFGAGSHGHIGVWSHINSFEVYLVMYYSLIGISVFNTLNFKLKKLKSLVYQIFNIVFIVLLLVFGFYILLETVKEDKSSYIENRVESSDYILIIVGLSVLAIEFLILVYNDLKNYYKNA